MTEESGLAQALVAAQAEMPNVDKDGKNPHFDSTFTTLDELIAKTRPKLNEHGLAIHQAPVKDTEGQLVLRTTIVHSSGEELAIETPLFLGRMDMQAFGSAITYARRYAWAALLGIASESDDDGNRAGSSGSSANTPAPPPPQQPQGQKMITDAQKKKLGATVNQLDRDGAPIPTEYDKEAETWVDVLRMRLEDQYGTTTRAALTSKQASELIDWFETMSVPF